jgi:hypothetical protein
VLQGVADLEARLGVRREAVVAGQRLVAPALSAEALDYALRASAPNTQRAYRAAWEDFSAWCAARELASLPAAPETVGSYLADRVGTLKVASLALRLVAIGQAHRLCGGHLDTRPPAIREV